MEAGKDGLHAENNDDSALGFVYISNGSVNIEAEGDGISAGAYMQIENGDFQILAGGGSVNGSSASSDAWGSFPRDRGRSDPSRRHRGRQQHQHERTQGYGQSAHFRGQFQH